MSGVSRSGGGGRGTLAGAARQTIQVTNSGRESVVVDVTRAGFALDLRGRPRIVSGGRRAWLTMRPLRLAIRPGGTVPLVVSSKPPPKAEPGDHDALVLLTTRARGSGLAVRIRLGVVVVVRVPGKIVRRVELRSLRVRRQGHVRGLELLVANRGNVTEMLDRRCVTVSLRRGGRVLARLRPASRQLLPRTTGIVEMRYDGRARGWVSARVEVLARGPCVRTQRRVFRIRL